jgi:hypothetical protein
VTETGELPDARRINARDLHLPRRKFQQFPPGRVGVRCDKTAGHEFDALPDFAQRCRQDVIITQSPLPLLSDSPLFEALAPERRCAAPREAGTLAQHRQRARIPGREQPGREPALHRHIPAKARGRAHTPVAQGRDQIGQPRAGRAGIGIGKDQHFSTAVNRVQ